MNDSRRRIIARIAVVARAAIAGQMTPGAEDVGDLFSPENGEPLLAAAVFEDPRELAVVEARVIDGGHFQIERLGVAKQKHALAGLRVFVEPAVGDFDTVTLQPELAIVA